MTSRTKHHDSNEYEKAPRLMYARTNSRNGSLNSMPCSFHDDRLEFLEKVDFMLKEPLPNNELRAMKKHMLHLITPCLVDEI